MSRGFPKVVAALTGLLVVLAPNALSAHTIGLTLGDGTRVSVPSGAKLTVPLNVDLSTAGGTTLAALQAGVTWGVGKLRLDSVRVAAGSGFALTANTTNVAGGQLLFNAYNPTGLASSGALVNLYFTGGTTAGGTSIELTPTAAGTTAGESIASQLTTKGLDVCVAGTAWSTTSARWGDANASGAVNVTDAQQLARYAVALGVTNLLATEERGDVNADALVDVLDALLVARFSAGLSAGTRVNTVMVVASDLPPVASVEVTGLPAVLDVGQSAPAVATPRAADGTSLAGCYRVTWVSSSTARATVSSTGLVTAKAGGSVTLTPTAGGVNGTALLQVNPNVVVSLTSGGPYSCVLRKQGDAYCWGTLPSGEYFGTPTRITPTFSWKVLSTGYSLLCGITTAGEAYCWGNNAFGQLGIGTAQNIAVSVPQLLPGQRAWTGISAQNYSACGTMAPDDAVYCWGGVGIGYSQERTPAPTPSTTPLAMPGNLRLTQLTSGSSHLCGRSPTGAWTCVGDTGGGLLDGSQVLSAGSGLIGAFGVGMLGSCTVTTDRKAFCFGANDFGQMANGNTSSGSVSYNSPAEVGPGISWARFFSGNTLHFCGIDTNANGYCWGTNSHGQVGDGTTVTRPAPVKLPGKWLSLAPGLGIYGWGNRDHTCGINADRYVYCLGRGGEGQLANGTGASSLVPVKVALP